MSHFANPWLLISLQCSINAGRMHILQVMVINCMVMWGGKNPFNWSRVLIFANLNLALYRVLCSTLCVLSSQQIFSIIYSTKWRAQLCQLYLVFVRTKLMILLWPFVTQLTMRWYSQVWTWPALSVYASFVDDYLRMNNLVTVRSLWRICWFFKRVMEIVLTSTTPTIK